MTASADRNRSDRDQDQVVASAAIPEHLLVDHPDLNQVIAAQLHRALLDAEIEKMQWTPECDPRAVGGEPDPNEQYDREGLFGA